MEAAGIDKVKGTLYTVTLQNSPPSVEVYNIDQVAVAWKVETVTVSVDKKAVLEHWKATEGRAVEDGITIKQGKYLRIR